MMRTVKLQQAYDELKTDLLEEVELVDERIIKPAMEAKDHIQPLKKVIKKRGDRKVRPDELLLFKTDLPADLTSWNLKNTNQGLTADGRRRSDQTKITLL